MTQVWPVADDDDWQWDESGDYGDNDCNDPECDCRDAETY